MGTETQWNGHHIQITCQPMLKYLWMATETAVTVDEREIGRAGGFGWTDRIRGSFGHEQPPHELVLETRVDLWTLVSIPYILQVDGSTVSQGRLKIDNWHLFFVPILTILAISCCAVGLLLLINNLPK